MMILKTNVSIGWSEHGGVAIIKLDINRYKNITECPAVVVHRVDKGVLLSALV